MFPSTTQVSIVPEAVVEISMWSIKLKLWESGLHDDSRKLGEYESNVVLGIIGNSNDCAENVFVFRQTLIQAVELKKLDEKMDSEEKRPAVLR